MPRHDSSDSAPAGRPPAPRDFTRQVISRTLRSYDIHAALYLRRWGRRQIREPRLLQVCLRFLLPGARILDLGCGPGQDTQALHRRRYRAVGVDLSQPFLLHARRRSRRTPLVQADMQRLPLRSGTFDAIWAAASLIHVPKAVVPRLLRDLKVMVHPGGLLAATFVHGRASGFQKSGWIPGRYFSRWHKEELSSAVRHAGWEIIELTTVTNRERKGRWLNLLARRP